MTKSALQNTTEKLEFDTWSEVVSRGDGYLTPQQRQAFERSIYLVLKKIKSTIEKTSPNEVENHAFDFERYVEQMEDRFLNQNPNATEFDKELSLTAYRVIESVAEKMLNPV